MRGLAGTSLVALAVAALLASLSLVSWRQRQALDTMEYLDEVRQECALETANREELESRIRHLESRGRVVSEAEVRLGMRTAVSSDIVSSARGGSMTSAPTRYRWRRRLLLAGWLVAGLVIVARSATVQVLQGSYWAERALAQHQQALEVPGRRGSILDRNENPLATSNETFQVSVAPRELRPETRDANVALLASELGLSRKTIRSISDPEKAWVEIQEGFPPRIREALEPIQGVYLKRGWTRHLHYGELASDVLGTIQDGSGSGGIEGGFDEHLRGTAGEEIQARDSWSKPHSGPVHPGETPGPGRGRDPDPGPGHPGNRPGGLGGGYSGNGRQGRESHRHGPQDR